MWWSWKNGYKFVRLDARTGRPYVFHAGAEDCEGTPDLGITCDSKNLGRIFLTDFYRIRTGSSSTWAHSSRTRTSRAPAMA